MDGPEDRRTSDHHSSVIIIVHAGTRPHNPRLASCSFRRDEEDQHSSFPSSPARIMAPEAAQHPDAAPPAFPGEDTRPTSRQELLGFYTYSFAAEVFVVCGLGAFIPITLEDLARASPTAVLAHDRTRHCKAATLDSLAGGNRDAFRAYGRHGKDSHQCVFHFLGLEINTASFAMYTFSLSVLLQACVVVTMSGAADHGQYRKMLLIIFAVTGSVATMLFLPVTPKGYALGALWAIIGNICIGASFVLLNSFLPLLVRWHPAVRQRERQSGHRTSRVSAAEDENQAGHASDAPSPHHVLDATTPLLPATESTTPYPVSPASPSLQMQLSTKISSFGVGIGYSAAIVVQILAIIILQTTGVSLFSLRLVLFVIGLWWLTFTIPAALWLRARPGPPLSFNKGDSRDRTWLGYFAYSWVSLGRTAFQARRLRDVLLFLAAWFLISDAIATVSGTAILFAKTSLGMESSALALINVIVTLSGIAGAFTWSKVSRLMSLSPSQTILTCICLFELIPIYGLLGYVPLIQRWGAGGLQQQWEMYPLGAVYGLVLGGLSSYCRSLFGELIPPGNEAAFFALFAITDKGSSVFGPAIVGAITDATGDIRPAFWFLAVLIGMPIPMMLLVNVERGRREGAELAKEAIAIPSDDLSGGGHASESDRHV
ncbi:Autophagy-related protein 22-2 [Teratosphaeria destructans]|uniref:Autophagy-related protein n=1 Tax=Teratosphaeria destructans TaxID=418781 RepID=A0A9W7W1J2_9PEZI|nr:Autophagy-related protein 22-2 [Teratosphaeria destructans]